MGRTPDLHAARSCALKGPTSSTPPYHSLVPIQGTKIFDRRGFRQRERALASHPSGHRIEAMPATPRVTPGSLPGGWRLKAVMRHRMKS